MCVSPFFLMPLAKSDAITAAGLDSRNRIGEWKNRERERTPGLITLIVSHPREHRARMGHPISWSSILEPGHKAEPPALWKEWGRKWGMNGDSLRACRSERFPNQKSTTYRHSTPCKLLILRFRKSISDRL